MNKAGSEIPLWLLLKDGSVQEIILLEHYL